MFSTLLLSGCSEHETECYNLKHVSKIAKMKEISSYFQNKITPYQVFKAVLKVIFDIHLLFQNEIQINIMV